MKKTESIMKEVEKAIVGKSDVIRKVMMVILAKGHILLEDIPGVGKTTMANAFAQAMHLQTNRIQFTVDVLPSDVVGFTVIDPNSGKIRLHKGAIFCNIFLADEINRTSSKTQAALLEVMEEGRITVDGYTQTAPDPFLVIATQNPYGSAGTQLLPESQLDRFMVRMKMGYPSEENEIEMLSRKQKTKEKLIAWIADAKDIVEMQKEVEDIFIHDTIIEYIVALIQKTRSHERIYRGASPRASIALMNMAKAGAYLDDREYVVPADVKEIFHDVVGHRVLLRNDGLRHDQDVESILQDILDSVEEPGEKK